MPVEYLTPSIEDRAVASQAMLILGDLVDGAGSEVR
jgi:hypothetical protein